MQKFRNCIFYTNESGQIWTGQGVRPQEFNSKWDSILEYSVFKRLNQLSNDEWIIKRQVPIKLILPEEFKPIKWVFDFVLFYPPTQFSHYIEVKGGYLKKSRTESRALISKLILFYTFNRRVYNSIRILSDSVFTIPGSDIKTIDYKVFKA